MAASSNIKPNSPYEGMPPNLVNVKLNPRWETYDRKLEQTPLNRMRGRPLPPTPSNTSLLTRKPKPKSKSILNRLFTKNKSKNESKNESNNKSKKNPSPIYEEVLNKLQLPKRVNSPNNTYRQCRDGVQSWVNNPLYVINGSNPNDIYSEIMETDIEKVKYIFNYYLSKLNNPNYKTKNYICLYLCLYDIGSHAFDIIYYVFNTETKYIIKCDKFKTNITTKYIEEIKKQANISQVQINYYNITEPYYIDKNPLLINNIQIENKIGGDASKILGKNIEGYVYLCLYCKRNGKNDIVNKTIKYPVVLTYGLYDIITKNLIDKIIHIKPRSFQNDNTTYKNNTFKRSNIDYIIRFTLKYNKKININRKNCMFYCLN